LVDTALDLQLATEDVISDTIEGKRCIFLAGLYRAEEGIADRLQRLAAGTPPRSSIVVEKAIPRVEERTGLSLAETQRKAVCPASTSKVLVITGEPGAGKTTLVNSLPICYAAVVVVSVAAAPPCAPGKQ
jgi:exodeoxyribonuclease V alpha subunit